MTGLPREQLARTCWPTVPEGLEVEVAQIRAYEEWSLRRGVLDRALQDEELFDFGPLAAAQELASAADAR